MRFMSSRLHPFTLAAIFLFNWCLTSFGQSFSEAVRMGDDALKRGDNQTADTYLTLAINSKPSNLKAEEINLLYELRSMARERLFDYKGAIEDCTKVLAAEPNKEEIVIRRKDCRVEAKDWTGALEDLTTLIGIRPQWGMAYGERGKIHSEKKEYQEAISDFTTAITLTKKAEPSFWGPTNPEKEYADNVVPLYVGRAFAEADLHQYEQAVADWETITQLKPDENEAYLLTALAYFGAAEIKKGINACGIALGKLQENEQLLGTAFTTRAQLRALDGDFDHALDDAVAALGKKGVDANDIFVLCARIHLLQQNPQSALLDLAKGKQTNQDVIILEGLARVAQKDWDGAMAKFGEARSVEGIYPEIIAYAVQVHLGHLQEAKSRLQGFGATANAHPEDWTSSIAFYLKDQLLSDKLTQRLSEQLGDPTAFESCRTWFYVGLKADAYGATTPVKDCYERCVATKMNLTNEYLMASYFLRDMAAKGQEAQLQPTRPKPEAQPKPGYEAEPSPMVRYDREPVRSDWTRGEVLGVWYVALAIMLGFLAWYKNRNVWAWSLVGPLFSIVSVITLLVLPRRCPSCGEATTGLLWRHGKCLECGWRGVEPATAQSQAARRTFAVPSPAANGYPPPRSQASSRAPARENATFVNWAPEEAPSDPKKSTQKLSTAELDALDGVSPARSSVEVPAAPLPTNPARAASEPPAKRTLADRFNVLEELRQQGLITEEEYQRRREILLNEI